MTPKPKPKGALVAIVAGAPKPDDEAPDSEPMGPSTDHGFKAVARAFGIPPEREASAQAALHQYIMSCTGPGDEESEEY